MTVKSKTDIYEKRTENRAPPEIFSVLFLLAGILLSPVQNCPLRHKLMAAAIISMLSEFPGELVKTITCDRGAEFANWQTIEKKLNCDIYFADPYCAWQKGTNENSNGLLREFYPKGRNLSRVSPKTLLRNLSLINNRPRKCLNYISAQDSWNLELQNLS